MKDKTNFHCTDISVYKNCFYVYLNLLFFMILYHTSIALILNSNYIYETIFSLLEANCYRILLAFFAFLENLKSFVIVSKKPSFFEPKERHFSEIRMSFIYQFFHMSLSINVCSESKIYFEN